MIEVRFHGSVGHDPYIFSTSERKIREYREGGGVDKTDCPLTITVPTEWMRERKLDSLDPDDLADRIVRAFQDWVEQTPVKG